MDIIPYTQTLSHSCLAACMLMLRGEQFTQAEEHELALNGSKRVHQFYVAGIPLEFVTKFNCRVVVHVDNAHFANILKELFSPDKRLHVIQKKIKLSLIRDLLESGPLICHIDDHSLGDYSHASHFIILERATDKFIQIIDPWTGKRRKISIARLIEGITDLKHQIKMCPVLFSIDTLASYITEL